MENNTPTPRPLTVKLTSSTQYPLGTLCHVWWRSRHDRELPSPERIEWILSNSNAPIEQTSHTPWVDETLSMLGFGPHDLLACARWIRSELEMIFHDSIPVSECIVFTFEIRNLPVTLREQLVRHRVGNSLDPRVGVDIIPLSLRETLASLPQGSLMQMDTIPDLVSSSFWSQGARVVTYDNFYDEGRFILPQSLKGKRITDEEAQGGLQAYLEMTGDSSGQKDCDYDEQSETFDAELYYMQHLENTQRVYRQLIAAGVHIEDARNVLPSGITHGISWTVNLKALMHIFGRRSSWIAQIGLWETMLMQMVEELVKNVHPMLRMAVTPKCISKGKYVGCPVAGTNIERINGKDPMPPCPLFVRYQTNEALQGAEDAIDGNVPEITYPKWYWDPYHPVQSETDPQDIRNWTTNDPVHQEMLERNAEAYSRLWGFPVFEGIPE